VAIANVLKALMLIAFGSAWPSAIYTSYTAKSNKGKSIIFLYSVLFGYVCGITYQYILLPDGKYVFALFIINSLMVLTDIALYYRNAYKYKGK